MKPINVAVLDAAFLGFEVLYKQTYGGTQRLWDKVARFKKSSTDEERFVFTARNDAMRKWEGERQLDNVKTHGFKLGNELYEKTFGVRRIDVDDDKLGVYNDRVIELARLAAELPDDLVFDALFDGETAVHWFDGLPFFAANHKVDPYDGTKGTQKNLHTSKALTAENYAYGRAEFRKFKGDDGRPMNYSPNLLVVGPDLEVTAKTIVHASVIPSTLSTGAGNAAKGTAIQDNVALRGTAEVVVSNKITGSDWYLIHKSGNEAPLIFQERDPAEFTRLFNREDPNVFWLDKYVFGSRWRGNAGYGPHWLAHKFKA